MLEIKIPKPCHEDWNAMTPTNRGAFCIACAKDVVDFTKMSDEEVQQYLINQSGEKVCGKFNNSQVHHIRINIPNHVFYGKIAGWKKFMAVFMLSFGLMLFGCDVTTDTAITGNTKSETKVKEIQLLGDTIMLQTRMGIPANVIECSVTKGEPAIIEKFETTTGIMEDMPPLITGDISVVPESPLREQFVIVGKISYVDTAIIKKPKKDSLPKTKVATDTTNCKEEHFF